MNIITEQFKQHIYDGLLDPTNQKYTFMKIDACQESLINDIGIKKLFEDCFGQQSFEYIGNCIFVSKWSSQNQKISDDKCIVTPMLRIKKGLSIYDTEHINKNQKLFEKEISTVDEFNDLWLNYQKNLDKDKITILKNKLDQIITN